MHNIELGGLGKSLARRGPASEVSAYEGGGGHQEIETCTDEHIEKM